VKGQHEANAAQPLSQTTRRRECAGRIAMVGAEAPAAEWPDGVCGLAPGKAMGVSGSCVVTLVHNVCQ